MELPAASANLAADGSFDLTLSLSGFHPVSASFGNWVPGMELVDWWFGVSDPNGRLEITGVELLPP